MVSYPFNFHLKVWIYGGGYNSGSTVLYDPKIFVAETNLIFVSMQYRVNIFGFMYMNDPDAPGNQGLLDQALALKWVQENIEAFGGDPSKVTIFGSSAGAASVSAHLLSPLSSSLFRNGIMESGSTIANWAFSRKEPAIKQYTGILSLLPCNNASETKNISELIKCARAVDSRTLFIKANEYVRKNIESNSLFNFLPVVDNYFLTDDPVSLVNQGKFKKCPILLGANKNEANLFFYYLLDEYRDLSKRPNISSQKFNALLDRIFMFYPKYPSKTSISTLESIKYRYTNWNNVESRQANFENLDRAAGDFELVCPTVDFANYYAMNNLSVYFYHFTERGSASPLPEWFGAIHTAEIPFVFGTPLEYPYRYTPIEMQLSRKMMRYWSNFVRYENPNGDGSSAYESNGGSFCLTCLIQQFWLDVTLEKWPKYEIVNNQNGDLQRAYLELSAGKVRSDYNFRAEFCAFWSSLVPRIAYVRK